MKEALAPPGVVTTTDTDPTAVSSGIWIFTCPGEINSTTAGLPLTVTEVPSRLTGSFPFRISVDSFHLRESPAGARLLPKTATQEPAVTGAPAAKLAPFTTAVTTGRG